MKDKFLPLGTIVLLKDANKKLMINGFLVSTHDDNNKVYDYCGCLYPEGILTTEKSLMFNHNMIDKIISLGYLDDEGKEFHQRLKRVLEDVNR